ncbi:NB-ARC domain-containing protein [Streptomyces sp. GTA36]
MRGQEWGGHNELSGVVHGPSVQAAVVHGDVHIRTGETAEQQLPWQLPPAVRLTDRTAEVERLERHRTLAAQRAHPALATVSGLGGVGKTALALAWLHGLRRDFPGGQLYADLCAQAPTGPVDPAHVLGSFLRGLGVPPQQVPEGVADRSALYRSLTADRRIVVLLDDAATAAQVRPLLPGGSNVTLVTSRRRMSGLALEGGYQVHLEPLAPEAAVELLAATLADDRVATQPDDARALVGLCAGLPLAVRVAGARLAARPQRRITTMVRAPSPRSTGDWTHSPSTATTVYAPPSTSPTRGCPRKPPGSTGCSACTRGRSSGEGSRGRCWGRPEAAAVETPAPAARGPIPMAREPIPRARGSTPVNCSTSSTTPTCSSTSARTATASTISYGCTRWGRPRRTSPRRSGRRCSVVSPTTIWPPRHGPSGPSILGTPYGNVPTGPARWSPRTSATAPGRRWTGWSGSCPT